jgi:hypothetical protein
MEMYKQQTKFAKDMASLIQHIMAHGYYVTMGECYRTPEQAEIYAKQGKGVKNSLHCKRLAVDLNIFTPEGEYLKEGGAYGMAGKFWESLDPQNGWGGNFIKRGGHIDDGNHFERRAG